MLIPRITENAGGNRSLIPTKLLSIKYKEGNLILLNKPGILLKLAMQRAGSYLIEKVHANGTVAIAMSMAVTDRVNTRQLQPYHEEPE